MTEYLLKQGQFIRFLLKRKPYYNQIDKMVTLLVFNIDTKNIDKVYIPYSASKELYSQILRMKNYKEYIYTFLYTNTASGVHYIKMRPETREYIITKYFMYVPTIMKEEALDVIDNDELGWNIHYIYKKLLSKYTHQELEHYAKDLYLDVKK